MLGDCESSGGRASLEKEVVLWRVPPEVCTLFPIPASYCTLRCEMMRDPSCVITPLKCHLPPFLSHHNELHPLKL